MTLIRTGFDETTRVLNGFPSWFLGLFSYNVKDSLRKSWKSNTWQKWWHQADNRPSTLNALVAAMATSSSGKQPVLFLVAILEIPNSCRGQRDAQKVQNTQVGCRTQ